MSQNNVVDNAGSLAVNMTTGAVVTCAFCDKLLEPPLGKTAVLRALHGGTAGMAGRVPCHSRMARSRDDASSRWVNARDDDPTLNEASLDPRPHRQFQTWLAAATQAGEPMPRAMALATTGANGAPSVRMVLLEEADERGFAFQTNLESPKARDLAAVPQGALVFFWPRLVRQVRVAGPVEELSRDEVATYFAAQPPALQTMIRACRQSEVLADRSALEQAFAATARAGRGDHRRGGEPGQLLASPVDPAPAYWGGYRLRVESIEFWQGRANWLQDRLRYTRTAGGWRIERLAP